jgi:hypothetical protein
MLEAPRGGTLGNSGSRRVAANSGPVFSSQREILGGARAVRWFVRNEKEGA